MGRGEELQEPRAMEHSDGKGERAEIMPQTFCL